MGDGCDGARSTWRFNLKRNLHFRGAASIKGSMAKDYELCWLLVFYWAWSQFN
jgi:hypothetical protein